MQSECVFVPLVLKLRDTTRIWNRRATMEQTFACFTSKSCENDKNVPESMKWDLSSGSHLLS
jgi:hypothetical protein